jgi:hypothetical protein
LWCSFCRLHIVSTKLILVSSYFQVYLSFESADNVVVLVCACKTRTRTTGSPIISWHQGHPSDIKRNIRNKIVMLKEKEIAQSDLKQPKVAHRINYFDRPNRRPQRGSLRFDAKGTGAYHKFPLQHSTFVL